MTLELTAPTRELPGTPAPPSPRLRPYRRRWSPRLAPGWPLTALFVGFPLWWVLGISHFVFILAAVPMAVFLLRRRPTFTPQGYGAWALFLAWVLAGTLLLWADAPGTQQVQGVSTVLPFGYRLAWYLACTVVLLYVLNLREDELPTRRVLRLMSVLFVVTVVGGLAGVFYPSFQLTSPMEVLLPGGQSGWINDLVNPAVSGTSDFLGYELARPKAPFAYANAWGNNLAMLLPFFVVAWLGRDAGWRRIVAPVVLLAATVPVVYSLNRGLWVGLAVAAVYVALAMAVRRRFAPIVALGGLGGLTVVLLLATPLADLVQLRIDTPHSNDRRADLATTVFTTTANGSPVAGYGNTRTLQGTFDSIAGADTAKCPNCAPPPLGTQGFLWRLVITTGFVGAALYIWFVGRQFVRFVRVPTPVALAGTTAILLSFVFFFFYDSLESPMYVLMIGIGLMNREVLAGARSSPGHLPGEGLNGAEQRPGRLPTIADLWFFLRRHTALLLALTILGGLLGGAAALARVDAYQSSGRVSMEAGQSVDQGSTVPAPPEQTLDTLARLVFSEQVVGAVSAATGDTEQDVVDSLGVSALPLSRVLVIDYVSSDPATALRGAEAAVDALVSTGNDVFGVDGTVLDAPVLPPAPVPGSPEVLVVSGALLGLVTAVAGARAAEGMGRTRQRGRPRLDSQPMPDDSTATGGGRHQGNGKGP